MMTPWQRTRATVNWVNLMTPLGLLVARIGSGTRHRGPNGLVIYAGYRRGLPIAGAFTLGNVITTRHGPEYLLAEEKAALLAHESVHSIQAAVLGPLFLPLYLAAAGWSWAISADIGGRNLFEVWAGLERGNYVRHPLRPWLDRALRRLRRRPTR
jgi:hypothetical protein